MSEYLIPSPRGNAIALRGRPEVLDALVREHGWQFGTVETTGVDEEQEGKRKPGRKLGSTNWTRDRFWRRYARVANGLRRPYRGTHLAVRIGLAYGTFRHYYELWGAPPGFVGPGD